MMRQRGVNIVLTNNSWGGSGYSQTLLEAIEAGRQAGMLFVTAAGNSNLNTDITPNYPSCYALDNIISVAATDYNDNKWVLSNYGATTVDLGAPGAAVYSTTPGDTCALMTGTSMAAPHVSGTAALAWSMWPNASYADIRNAIFAGTDPIAALSPGGATPTVTGGRLNAFGTIAQIGMVVTGASPEDGQTLVSNNPPMQFEIRFSFPVDRTTLQAADLRVNNKKATSVTLSPDNLVATLFLLSLRSEPRGRRQCPSRPVQFGRCPGFPRIRTFAHGRRHSAGIQSNWKYPGPVPLTAR
jgi:hypothetical protein